MRELRRLWATHRGLLVTVIVFVCVLLLMAGALSTVRERTGAEQQTAVYASVMRAAATCYAAEGFYPADIAYLTEHYGLTWDQSRYIIRYDCFAANILPDVDVLVRGAERT